MTDTGTGGPDAAARRLLRVVLPVSDPVRLAAFYRDALGFTVLGTRNRGGEGFARATATPGARAEVTTLRLGGQHLELERHLTPARPYPAGSRSQDLWFQHVAIIVADMDAACRRLRGVGCVAISLDGPQRLPESSGGVLAFKFRDPDGHPLELLQFPAGREPDAWRTAAAARDPAEPCLGLDHSAIGVADAAASARFYAATLGLAKAKAGVNTGSAQHRLDDAADPVVDVVAMTPAAAPPHVELLGYRAPSDGRPMPADATAADIVAARLVLEVARLDEPALRAAGARFVSAGVVDGDEGRTAFVRDPDGHLLELRQA